MYQKGLELAEQAFEIESGPNFSEKDNLSKTFQGLFRIKELVELRIEEIKNTKLNEKDGKISTEKIEEMRGHLITAFEPNAQLFYWLPEGIQLVVIEVFLDK